MSTKSIHQFAEKVALISDAGSPVGRAVAMQLALNGSFVIGLFQQEGGSVESLVELGTLAHAFNIDPSTDAGSAEAAAEVEHIFGRLDLLVNCLKYRPESSFADVTDAGFAEVMRRNAGSVQSLTRAVFPLMTSRPKPRIVNIAWQTCDARDPSYAASQAAVVSLTRSFGRELPPNFRVNGVEVVEIAAGEPGDETTPTVRLPGAAPDEIARAALFLLSSESAAMNGRMIRLG